MPWVVVVVSRVRGGGGGGEGTAGCVPAWMAPWSAMNSVRRRSAAVAVAVSVLGGGEEVGVDGGVDGGVEKTDSHRP